MKGQEVNTAMNAGKSSELRRVLRASALPYRTLFENLPVGVCWVGLNGRVLYSNPTMLKLTGYSDAEISRINAKELLRDAGELPHLFDGVASDAPDGHADGKLVRKDGTFTLVRLTGSRVVLNGGEAILLTAVDHKSSSKVEDRLEMIEHTLEEKEQALRHKSIALEELVEQIQVGRSMLKEDIATNIRDFVLPIVEKLRLTSAPAEMIDLLERTLQEITSRFSIRLSQSAPSLSPRESEITQMIHCGLITKQIAKMLSISYETVEKHRRNIRRKVGITGKKINLASFLSAGQ
jgi:PAS domain S-box-containing protein